MAKSKPIGVRFDTDILEEIYKDLKLETPQQVLNYLMSNYKEMYAENKIVVKQDLLGAKDVVALQKSIKKGLNDIILKKDKEGVLEGSNAFFLKYGAFYFKDLK